MNELEEQVVRLIKAVAHATIFFERGDYSPEETVNIFLEKAEVKLHQQSIDELIEYFSSFEIEL